MIASPMAQAIRSYHILFPEEVDEPRWQYRDHGRSQIYENTKINRKEAMSEKELRS